MLAGPVSGLRATIVVEGCATARAAAAIERVIAAVVFGLSTSSLVARSMRFALFESIMVAALRIHRGLARMDSHGNPPFLDCVARDLGAVRPALQLRTLGTTALVCMRAARMERAAGWWIERARDLA